MLSMAAYGGQDSSDDAAANSEAVAATEAAEEAPATEEEQAADAELEDTLVVYTTHSEEMLEVIATAFTAMDIDWSVISENQSAWLEKWETDHIDADKTVAKE